MEKFSQFRDRGSGIAPFFPVTAEPAGIYFPFHLFLFTIRVPTLIFLSLSYIIFTSWLPIGSLIKKAALWSILGVSGIWWIDLQIDNVKRGKLAQHVERLPQPGTVIASSFTSPVDCLYLAAIFDPIFTASYPGTRNVQRIGLFQAIARALYAPQLQPPPNARLIPLSQLLQENPNAAIVVLPECTTTNGRGILSFTPSLLSAPSKTKIFPVSMRYTPQDITTPIPSTYLSFLWNLCSRPTHVIRVRIAEAVYNNTFETNFFDGVDLGTRASSMSTETLVASDDDGSNQVAITSEELKVLERVGEDLARLGRVKRVGLSVREKVDFLKVWKKGRKGL